MSELDPKQSDRIAKLSPEKQALLAMRLKAKRGQAAASQPISRRGDMTAYPMSYAQQRMWFLSQWEPESPFYNISSAVRIYGLIDLKTWKDTFNDILQRHDVLRARFITVGGQPTQIIGFQDEFDLPIIDLSRLSELQRESKLKDLITKETNHPFDLTKGPLIRCSVIVLKPQEHVLLLTMHHIISDGWSISLFIREAAMLYEARTIGRPSPLADLQIQYSDFAEWQRGMLQGENLKRQLEFWKDQLGHEDVVLDLPFDRPRQAVQTFNGATHKFKITQHATEQLKILGQRNDATLFMTMLAAFQVLLNRYSGQEDVRVGTPIANRGKTELEGLIGLFVNTLVMRADFSKNLSFVDHLRELREMALGAYSHQDLPLEMLLEELKVSRDMSRTPLYQVMFTLQDQPLKILNLSSIRFEVLEPETTTSKFDLTLFLEEHPEGLDGVFEYNTDLFDESTIDLMTRHFIRLLDGIISDPNQKVSHLPLMTDSETHRILVDWNSTFTNYPWDKNLAELFDIQVNQTPEAIAIRFPDINDPNVDKVISYRRLNDRANQIAHLLQKYGVGPDVLVGLFMERSMNMVVATLGIIKAGGAYLPLDLGYPIDRLSFMLEDSQVNVLLTLSEYASDIEFLNNLLGSDTHQPQMTIISLDDPGWQQIIDQQPTSNPFYKAGSENLAYMMYTSGSTGRPKGVAIPQRAINRLVFNTNYLSIESSDRIAHASNPSFDAATIEIWGALLHGAELVGVNRDVVLSSRAFVSYLVEKKITTIFLTTALFNHIAHEIPDGFATLQNLMIGGEAADVNTVRIVHDAASSTRFMNLYGPTESTTFATWYLIEKLSPNARTVPIGKPISNTQVYILDRNLQPVPVGVIGELYIGGDGLAKGYYNRDELSAERFIPNPYFDLISSNSPGHPSDNRLYKTGDLVRYLKDGSIEFVGRSDFQVKMRGLRIELGEIETAINHFPAISENVVLLREDVPGEKRLVAYLVPKPTRMINLPEIRRFLKDKLPEFMVPSVFIILDSLPINPNGKVDRRALPIPDQTRPDLDKAFVPPRTPVEKYLVSRFQEVLGIDRVGVYDDFFELGGDSLKAAILMNRLQEELEVSTHVRAIFMAPTVTDLAMYMNEYYPSAAAKIQRDEEDGLKTDINDRSSSIDRSIAADTANVGADHDLKDRVVDEDKIKQILKIIRQLPSRPDDSPDAGEPPNPPAIFVLSPPRSGSTLLRTMLAGNPRLFSPPELDLLSFNSLAERRTAFSSAYTFWLEGLERAIMELKNCSAEKARQLMQTFETQGLTTKQFYRLFQQWIAGSSPSAGASDRERLLVDKTPVYALDLEILKRAEQDFSQPFYIHLIRHPMASIYSFIEAKLDGVFFRYDHPFTHRELAELVWIVSHQNILTFLKNIPAERQIRIAFEDLVNQPEELMEKLCQFLSIQYDPRMIKPYDGDRMTSGIRPGAQMVGDFKFYLRKDIDPKAADRWKKFSASDTLSPIGWQVAEQLGYVHDESRSSKSGLEVSLTQIKCIPRDGELPLSFAQQRLWFLDQWEPGSPYYNVPTAVRMQGALNLNAMHRTLEEIVGRHEVLRTTFPVIDGRPAQNIAPKSDIQLKEIDLQHLPGDQREITAKDIAITESRRSFDLARGPLMYACVIRLTPEDSIFLLIMHHIISDGWSARVLIREIAILYPAYSAQTIGTKELSILPELPVQYVDFAAWQRDWLQGEILNEQLTYWRQKLGDAPGLLELPTDRPRPAVQTLRGAHLQFDLPEGLANRLRVLSHQEEATLFMTLLAAFKILLYRYTGQEDFCVGTPIANRNRAEIEGLIGFFVNTLVLRSSISNEMDFRRLLTEVKQVAIEAYDHQDFPFEQLVDELHLSRDKSHTPLFQVMFTLQESSIQSLKLPNLILTPIQIDSGTAKFDLLLTAVDMGSVIKGVFEYNTDLFDEHTIELMVGHFQTLLQSIVDTPEQSIATLPMLTETEKKKLLVEWNRTLDPGSNSILSHSIPELFELQVARTPHAPAVVFWDQQLSFQELNQRADLLASTLRELGITRGEIVGLYIERSIEMIVGILGILKAGGAYLPLDPEYPRDRLAFILQDAQVSVILTRKGVEKQVDEVLEELTSYFSQINTLRMPVCVPIDENILINRDLSHRDGSTDNRNNMEVIQPDDLAYVIYTSGSTGKPKGVMIEHRSALNLWMGLNQVIYSRHADRSLRVSLNAPLLFDASVQEWLMLLSGHTLVLIPQEVRQDGESLLQYIRDKKIDVLDCVPSQLKMLIENGLLDSPDAETRSWVPQAILPGGEAIDEKTWQLLAENANIEFYNMYGPTECSVDSTICWVKEHPLLPSIGRPIVNAQMYILDPQLQPVPVGVHGELWIGGIGVGRGYLNRESLTAERFIPNPFKAYQVEADLGIADDDRLYRTGDRVRYLPNGYLVYLGRVDFQVKLRGFRIELGDIESALVQVPGVKEAVVVVREDNPGEKQLVGYIVPDQELVDAGELNASTLRNAVKLILPPYMIPGIYIMMDALPLTPNRKVDRKALPKPEGLRLELESEYQEPQTTNEKALAEIWAQVLKLDRVGIYDNFFELGGDSILSIQVVAKANQAGLRLTPRHIFEAQTISDLAQLVDAAPIAKVDQGLVTGPVPLTPIQSWFFEQNFLVKNHWNQALLFNVRLPLQIGLLKDSVYHLMRYHDALRMRFKYEEGRWIQYNDDIDSNIPVTRIDFSMVSPENYAEIIKDYASELQASLNIEKGPLLRVVFLDMGFGKPGRLLFIIHHLVIDGVSWRVLLDDLQTAYQQLSQGLPVELPLKTHSFQTWANSLREYAQSGGLQDEIVFWRRTINRPVGWSEQKQPLSENNIRLPLDYTDGLSNLESTVGRIRLVLSEEETHSLLRDVPAAYNTEINDLLLTALTQAIVNWTGRNTVTITLEGHGREPLLDLNVSRTLGWFTSIYPVSLTSNPFEGPGERLISIKEQIRQIPRNGIGFGILRYLSPNAHQLADVPLGDVSFNYLGQVDQTLQVDSPFSEAMEDVGLTHSPKEHRSHIFDIIASVTQSQLRIEWLYNERLHRYDTVSHLADTFMNEIRILINHCVSLEAGGYSPSDFPEANLSQDDIDELLKELED